MSVRRMPRSRRNGFLPSVDGLEARLVLATAPTNPLAIPIQVAQINAESLAISNTVVNAVPSVLAVHGHLSAAGVNTVTAGYALAQTNFAQLQADQAAGLQAIDDELSTLKEGKFILDSEITANYNAQIAFITNYYNSLTPTQQAAQASAIQANLVKVNQATAAAYQVSSNYYVGKENAAISLYNKEVPLFNTALANAANAVRLTGNLYVYVVNGSSTPIAAPIYTPVQPIKPVV